ncbi:hypothetical protein K439DRAFT_1615923 [Ramaria rubella]|nr:hypothetical protein K439DRAFT_1615923 [Ramaria rubella]
MPIVWIYPYAMEVRQAWSTGSCISGFADIRDILRYVGLSTSTLKGMDLFNVITHGKSGWPEDLGVVCLDTLCACKVTVTWPISTSTMYHTHLHALLFPMVCSLQHKGMSACPQIQVSQGGLEVAVTCSIFTSTRCHTLACVFAATAMRMWYLT